MSRTVSYPIGFSEFIWIRFGRISAFKSDLCRRVHFSLSINNIATRCLFSRSSVSHMYSPVVYIRGGIIETRSPDDGNKRGIISLALSSVRA
jgi:hypothetical protein